MTNNNIYFVANWKMYGHIRTLNSLKTVINLSNLSKFKKKKIVYCPPFTLIDNLIKKTKKSNIIVGAQDCYENEKEGPSTGNICAYQLKKLGVKYVILGHSEKRKEGDTNLKINKKIKSAISQNLKVILCVGETLKEYNDNKTNLIIKNQVMKCLKGIKKINNIIFAYEPVWSIGTGLIPDNKKIFLVSRNLKKLIKKNFKRENPYVLYGGSVDHKNIIKLREIENINGYLIGSASRNVNKFIDIIKKTII